MLISEPSDMRREVLDIIEKNSQQMTFFFGGEGEVFLSVGLA